MGETVLDNLPRENYYGPIFPGIFTQTLRKIVTEIEFTAKHSSLGPTNYHVFTFLHNRWLGWL